jgi:hypothetical protein
MMQKINYFIFLGLLFIGFLTGLNFPDTDQGYKIALGHRSIITHSILLPYILYYFFIKKRVLHNKYLTLIIIGIFLGIGLHLSADLFPKGWIGYALIKLPGNIGVGGLSPIWIGFNALASLYFAGSCLNNLTKQKSIWLTYLIFGTVAGFLYSIKETYNNETIFIAFYITFILTFIISKLLSKSGTVDDQPGENKKITEEEVKKLSFKDKLFRKIKTPEGVATIGGATAGGWFGSSVGLAGFWGGIAGTFPIAIVGATVGYLGIKVIKYKRKLNQIKAEEKSKKKPFVKTASYVAIIITGIVIIFYLI